jgi:hypothetical protein
VKCTEDSRRAALTQAAARRRGSRGQSPLVGEARNLDRTYARTKSLFRKSRELVFCRLARCRTRSRA